MSKSFSFNRDNAEKVYKVFLWTMASALVTLGISLLGVIEMPVEYVWIVPIVNTALYTIKQLVEDQRDGAE
jgi:hypothetical protein